MACRCHCQGRMYGTLHIICAAFCFMLNHVFDALRALRHYDSYYVMYIVCFSKAIVINFGSEIDETLD